LAEDALMPGVFLDTNIILYAARPHLDPLDMPKRAIAIGLIAEEDFATSGQVLAEFYHNAVKKGPHTITPTIAQDWLDNMSEQPCVPVSAELVKSGVALSERYQISYWDGAILAAAHESGATTLYTEDLNDGQVYGAVTAINPFKQVAH
jgi:predicted nucleic acid-binding protein